MLTVEEENAINKASMECFNNSFSHGFWDEFIDGQDPLTFYEHAIPIKLALIHSEVSEALEGDRNGIAADEKGGLGEELADVVIRVFDLAAAQGIAIGSVIAHKMEVNASRPKMHGKRY